MDGTFYTAALDEVGHPPTFEKTLRDRERRPELRGQWIGHDGQPLGERDPIHLELGQPVEVFEEDGPDWQRLTGAIRVDAPPQGFGEPAQFQIFEDDRLIKQIPFAAMSRFEALGAPRLTERFGDAGADRELRVFSERFQDFERFNAAVSALHRHLLTRRPFHEDEVRRKLSVRGYFWWSDAHVGRFNTPDPPTRLFHGDLVAAWKLLYPQLQLDLPGIVLIDSSKGGGAGGSQAIGATPGHVAWASIAEIADYPWQDVALHEIGHAMGLGDEYVSDDGLNYSSYEFAGQPNVSSKRDRKTIAWSGRLTTGATGDAIDSEADFSGPDRPRVVGVFRGAFYRKGWFRPSPDCLMRKLDNDFCPVCSAALRQKLTRL